MNAIVTLLLFLPFSDLDQKEVKDYHARLIDEGTKPDVAISKTARKFGASENDVKKLLGGAKNQKSALRASKKPREVETNSWWERDVFISKSDGRIPDAKLVHFTVIQKVDDDAQFHISIQRFTDGSNLWNDELMLHFNVERPRPATPVLSKSATLSLFADDKRFEAIDVKVKQRVRNDKLDESILGSIDVNRLRRLVAAKQIRVSIGGRIQFSLRPEAIEALDAFDKMMRNDAMLEAALRLQEDGSTDSAHCFTVKNFCHAIEND